jgi:hypothetical protein
VLKPGTVIITGALLAVVALAGVSAKGKPKDPPIDLAGLLARVGERVEAYYQRAQSIVCTETVRFQTMDSGFNPDPHVRRLVYELRVSWDKAADGDTAPEASVLRTLKTVNGKPPKPGEEPKCLDPKPVALDPLEFLLPRHQQEYTFTYEGVGKAGDGHSAVMVDYKPTSRKRPEFAWDDSCFSVDAPTRTTGRVWIDRFDGDILRIDETLAGPLDVRVPDEQQRQNGGPDMLTVDRIQTSIHYRMVTFTEPDEIVLLPESIEQNSTLRGAGLSRQRTTHEFTDYRRFVTGARIVTPQ